MPVRFRVAEPLLKVTKLNRPIEGRRNEDIPQLRSSMNTITLPRVEITDERVMNRASAMHRLVAYAKPEF